MKFLYEYRTRDNVRHEGVISAASKDAAFAALKSRGIRPGSVVEAPGLLNKVLGKGKRWIAIAVLAVAFVATLLAYFSAQRTIDLVQDFNTATIRRQVFGDSAIIEKGVRSGWADVFPEAGERFLAAYAIPGIPSNRRSVKEADLVAALSRDVAVKGADGLEARQIKLIVKGMKDELREYIKDGGSLSRYVVRMIRRQEEEVSYYARAKRELEEAQKRKMPARELEALWEKRNAELRAMGIKLIPMAEIAVLPSPK